MDGPSLAAWRAILAAEPALASPLFTPAFARAVEAHRADTRVAVLRRDGAPLAFFPHQRRPDGLARPLGAPFGDYQTVIARAEASFDTVAFLAAAGIRRFAFHSLVDPHGRFAAQTTDAQPTYQLRTDGAAPLEPGNARFRRALRGLPQKTEAALGPLRLVFGDMSGASLDRMLDWKSAQMDETGVTNVVRSAWVRPMLHAMRALREGDACGYMVSLYAGETLLAGKFGLRKGDLFHAWIAAMNPAQKAFMPGHLLLLQMASALAAHGIRTLDLGIGHGHYKTRHCNQSTSVGVGAVGATIPGRGAGFLAQVVRRIDHVATAELTLAGRLRGVADAAHALRRRHAHAA